MNTRTETERKIDEMLKQKNSDLDHIAQMQEDARRRKAAAEEAERAATENMDLEAYEAAKEEKRKARLALDMYGEKFKQLKDRELTTEEESDAVIDSLLSYEADLARDFEEKASEHIEALAKISAAYFDEVTQTEKTLKRWQIEIHRNYRSQTATYADGSHRSPHPVPVRSTPYNGCEQALTVARFLDNVKPQE